MVSVPSSDKQTKNLSTGTDEALLRHIIDQMPDIFILKDKDAKFVICNKALADLYNTTPDAMTGKDDGDFGIPKAMNDAFRENILGIIEKGETEVVYEDSLDTKTGETRHFKSIKKPIINVDGEQQVLVIAQDITDLILIQKKVELSEKRLNTVLDIIHEGIWDWHIPSGKVSHNEQWYKILNYPNADKGNTVEEFMQAVHPDDRTLVNKEMGRLLSGEVPKYISEHRMITADGSPIYVRDRGVIVEYDDAQNPVRVLGSVKNITQEKMAAKSKLEQEALAEQHRALEEKAIELTHLATTDPLSKLKNRMYCEDILIKNIDKLHSKGTAFAVLLIDVDHFKVINDTYGHNVGDQTILWLAELFEHSVRHDDTVGRWGGEEFLIICPGATLSEASALAERIRKKIERAHSELWGKITCSFGVTEALEKDTPKMLIKRSDQALYKSKHNGRNLVTAIAEIN